MTDALSPYSFGVGDSQAAVKVDAVRCEVAQRLRQLADHIEQDSMPWLCSFTTTVEAPFIDIRLLLSFPWGG